jgi:hypothetical protein
LAARQATPGTAQLPLKRGTAQVHAIREGLLQPCDPALKLFGINHLETPLEAVYRLWRGAAIGLES